MTHPDPNPAALFSAAMAPLLHRPISEAAQGLTEDLLRRTLDWQAKAQPRQRARTEAA